MKEILSYIISDIAFMLATFIVTYILYAIRIKKSTMYLLQINIYVLFKECKKVGYRTIPDSKAFFNLLSQYYKLGGDDYIHDVEKRFREIEEKTEL